ncbi:MAG: hypothetical protein F6K53_20245 [Moorea sp. SIO4A1]|uniref:hypothetical protein n=1 Tax=Moorena sp. SIO4A1 TaxID=2607835 RepID=UPI001417FCE9|nr:hypothetical protein [Moorena sp. SIO4A1]NEO43268.1 hypothetical protein [Moorena sp. SIO4A3]NEQ59603.1 hypothetical protein [Moorena sp. SIO4A1]
MSKWGQRNEQGENVDEPIDQTQALPFLLKAQKIGMPPLRTEVVRWEVGMLKFKKTEELRMGVNSSFEVVQYEIKTPPTFTQDVSE